MVVRSRRRAHLTARVATAMTAAAGLVAMSEATAAPSQEHVTAARTAATWLTTQLEDDHLTSFGSPDWGLTIDALLAFQAAGIDSATVLAVTEEVATNVRSYNSYDDWGITGVRDAGATAKLLVAAVSTDSDPSDFGGYDLRAEALALVSEDGDQSNTFDQSLAVIGLARSGGVPQEVVDFLLLQQCSVGGFRLYPDVSGELSPSCDAQGDATLDVDTTAMAGQALLVAAEQGATAASDAATRGAEWLADQGDDGAFGGSGTTTTGANANSTGLAGQTLAAVGLADEANAAATWVAALQRDQWRRATAQALLALAQVPLGQIGEAQSGGSPSVTSATSSGITTSASASKLPTTGQPVLRILGLALALIALGTAVLVLTRRRRSA